MRRAAAAVAFSALAASARGWGLGCSKPDDFGDVGQCQDGMKAGQLCRAGCDSALIRPTQGAVGEQLVHCKAGKFNGKSDKKMEHYLQKHGHWVTGVLGPEGGFYVVDHHHLVKAVCESSQSGKSLYLCPRHDLSTLSVENFWSAMRVHRPPLCWLEDERGGAIAPSSLAPSVAKITGGVG
eukprot:TRINITY_DN13319_c0_g1_i3.p1 TRINITY_DN13319_c0_g1~~TRINITY_DN13319_c0_g1_i3.p1  ORF type:complete len:181 (+),score=42.49 TRINITY_DN13319_c0_g1_i3:75-617(+)